MVSNTSRFMAPRSALLPRQFGHAPATQRVAVPLCILLALKTFQHIVAIAIAGSRSESGSSIGAHSTTTDEYHQCLLIYLLLELGNEMRVLLHARIGCPFDFHGTVCAPNPIQLGAGTHIHQFGAGRGLQNFISLVGIQRSLVG